MFDVTWPNGRKAQINGASVVRIRRTVHGEQGATRIDLKGLRFQLVTEQPSAIAAMAVAELRSLTSIHSPDGGSVWFDAKSVTGPVYVTPFERKGTQIKSAGLIFPPKKQYTLETGEKVAEIIRAAGGSPEPVPPAEGFMATVQGWFSSILGSQPSLDLPEDDGPPGAVLDQ